MMRGFDFSFIDFDKMIEDWAWERFLRNRTIQQRRMQRKNIHMEISWDKVTFQHFDADFDEKTARDVPKAQTLFVTTFTNRTNKEQEYKFNAVRSTRIEASVFIESGFTIGDQIGVKLNVPQAVLEANVGFKKELTLTKKKANTFEHQIEWGVDSQVNVEPMSSTMAEVKIAEKEFNTKFTATTRLQGIVRVTFLNKKKNNAFVKQIEGDIRTMFENKLRGVPNVDLISDDDLKITTVGHCNFRFGSEQVVCLTEHPLGN